MDRRKYCLIGIPDHEGVLNVGGRIGAALGPAAFKKCFARLKGRGPISQAEAIFAELAEVSRDVSRNHRAAADLVRERHRATGLSVAIGGGHDHGYSHLLGLSEAVGKEKRLGCINIDAHLDVRKPSPSISSGSPFYLAMESGLLHPKRFIEFGIQSHCNGPELWDYIERKTVTVFPFEKLRHGNGPAFFARALRSLRSSCDAIAVSLDLDAAASSFSPGVSAPQAEGFSSSEIIEMMEIAGAHPKVISLGIFELNPEHDIDDRSARLAATAAYHFLDAALARKG